ncbi:MAG: hypothetical protein ABIZ04_15730 [Opitutus sp.]
MSELKLDLEYPAIKEMIVRRSSGDPDYVTGVRAYLVQGKEPPNDTAARRGYLDAHDMVGYLSTKLAELRADTLEKEVKLFFLRTESVCVNQIAIEKSVGISTRTGGLKLNQGPTIEM